MTDQPSEPAFSATGRTPASLFRGPLPERKLALFGLTFSNGAACRSGRHIFWPAPPRPACGPRGRSWRRASRSRCPCRLPRATWPLTTRPPSQGNRHANGPASGRGSPYPPTRPHPHAPQPAPPAPSTADFKRVCPPLSPFIGKVHNFCVRHWAFCVQRFPILFLPPFPARPSRSSFPGTRGCRPRHPKRFVKQKRHRSFFLSGVDPSRTRHRRGLVKTRRARFPGHRKN